MLQTTHKDFCRAFRLAISGKVTQELTAREIQSKFPSVVDLDAFHNGILDGLKGDCFRFNLTTQKEVF